MLAHVDRVGHLAVEVDEVRRGQGAQPVRVEVGVPPDQRIVGPRDQVDAALERPRPLVQLERAADVATGRPGDDAGDVGVQQRTGRVAQEGDADADGPIVGQRDAAVVPGVRQRAQESDRHRPVVGARVPDLVDHGERHRDLVQVLGELDPHARAGRRRVGRRPGDVLCGGRRGGGAAHAVSSAMSAASRAVRPGR